MLHRVLEHVLVRILAQRGALFDGRKQALHHGVYAKWQWFHCLVLAPRAWKHAVVAIKLLRLQAFAAEATRPLPGAQRSGIEAGDDVPEPLFPGNGGHESRACIMNGELRCGAASLLAIRDS